MKNIDIRLKIKISIILTFLLFGFCFGQNKPNENPILQKDYYKINSKQKEIVEFYLLARFYYPFGKIRSYDKMYWLAPDLIAIDKDGEILDFDSYKTKYKEAGKYNKEFSINLFYLDLSSTRNDELRMSYTVLEPDWENVPEVKKYEYKQKCPTGCEELFELPIRKIHKPVKLEKFNQKFLIFYINDYE